MNSLIPALPCWASKLVGSTVVTSSCLPLFAQMCCCEGDSLEAYLCKILTPFRHQCFLTKSGLLQRLNTCIYLYSSPGCWNFRSRGSWKMCILCSVILITLFVELESRILFLFLNAYLLVGPVSVLGWWASFMGKTKV